MTQREIIGHRISSQMFTISRAADRTDPTCWFTTKLSTLNSSGFNPLKRVWSNAVDRGFVMVSERTGREAIFTLIETVRDAEGNVVKYIFAPVFSTVHRNSGLSNCVANVYNT